MNASTYRVLREAVIAELSGRTLAEGRICDSKPLTTDPEELKDGPKLSVWTPKRHGFPLAGHRAQTVSLSIVIQGVRRGPAGSPDICDRLDTLAEQISDVLLSGTFLKRMGLMFEDIDFAGGIDVDHPSLGSFDLTLKVQHNREYKPTLPAPSGQVHHVTTDPEPETLPDTEQTIVVTAPPVPSPEP